MNFDEATISGQHLDISYSDVSIQSPEQVNLTVGDRSINLFLDPNHFPVEVDGTRVNLCMVYDEGRELMTVQSIEPGGDVFYGHGAVKRESSMEVFEMSEYQKTVAFLYLLGDVLHGS